MSRAEIDGYTAPSFAPIADTFARALALQGHGGAALTVRHRGEVMVDLRGGDLVDGSKRQLLFSVSKVVCGVATLMAHDRGLLDIDQPLAAYWTELDRPETRTITPRMVLSHRSGLVGVRDPLPLDVLLADGLEKTMALEQPQWRPGEDHGYHPWSFGALLQGAFRRTVGMDLGSFVASEINKPLGTALELGVPVSRQADVVPYEVPDHVTTELQDAWASDPRRTYDACASGALQAMSTFNDPQVIAAPWPASNFVGRSSDIATVISAAMGEGPNPRLLREETFSALITQHSRGLDRTLGYETAFGLGVQLPYPHLPMLGEGSFGHEGAGGALAVGSQPLRLAIGFTTTVAPSVKGASPYGASLLPGIALCARGAA